MKLIDYLLSSYGLISGSVSEVAEDLVTGKIMPDVRFEIESETKAFIDAISFLSKTQEIPNKHVLFQHTPGWTIVLSNSNELDSFSRYQENISRKLNRKTIGIVDIEDIKAEFNGKKYSKTLTFRMLDENANTVKNVSTLLSKDKLNSNELSELIKQATQYDQSLEDTVNSNFFLIEEK